jgi:hypothetical protein
MGIKTHYTNILNDVCLVYLVFISYHLCLFKIVRVVNVVLLCVFLFSFGSPKHLFRTTKYKY